MDISEEIKHRIEVARAEDKDAKLEDFQIRATENGYVLIHLKTKRAQLIYDADNEIHDLEQLFPGASKPCVRLFRKDSITERSGANSGRHCEVIKRYAWPPFLTNNCWEYAERRDTMH